MGIKKIGKRAPQVFLSVLCTCSVHDRSPRRQSRIVSSLGMPHGIRAYGDEYAFDTVALIAEYRRKLRQFPKSDGLNILTLFGGGADGVYGAGVLADWSQSGTRPNIDMGTGIFNCPKLCDRTFWYI